jgi:hypothetical protein
MKHSIKQVFGNLEGALRVSAVLYIAQFVIAQFVVGALFGSADLMDQEAAAKAMTEGTYPWGSFMITMISMTFVYVWVVVGWHRYVLLEESPSFVPKLEAGRIFAYLGKSLLIFLLLIPVVLVAGILFGIVGAVVGSMPPGAAGNPVFGMAIGVLLVFPISLFVYRMSPLLPAAAIGRTMTISQAWGAMKGEMGMLAMLGLISTALTVALSLPTLLLLPLGTGPLMAYQFVVGWIQLMVGASIITTLYGIYVEGRTLAYS